MPSKRVNKATLEDPDLQDAFLEGVKEGVILAATATFIYVLEITFQGTQLRRVEHSDLDQALVEARDHLANGPETEVRIIVTAVSNQGVTPPATQISQPVNDDEVVDAEVVEQ